MVHFCKRIGSDLIKVCNQLTKANGIAMIQQLLASCDEDGSGGSAPSSGVTQEVL